MGGIFGAFKGIWGGLVLLVVVGLVPTIATLTADWAQARFDVGFWPVFAVVMMLEGFLALCALFGIASAVQKGHAARVGPAGAQSQSGESI